VRGLPKFEHPDLLIGTDGFSDAGVFRLRDDLLILQSLDFFPPLVDDPYLYGQIAAANSLSDIYAMGGDPTTALNIVGFPDDKLSLDILHEILRGGAERVKAAGALLVGGHTVRDTEIKYGLSVTGTATPEALLTNSGAQPGDHLVLTKALGTGFVTTAFKRNRCPEDVLATATESMAQLNKAGSEAARAVRASASTDITGFGLAGHAGEMAGASSRTLVLDLAALPVLPGAAELAAGGYQSRASKTNRSAAAKAMRIEGSGEPLQLEMAFDPQTSGGLLISVAAGRAGELVEKCRAAGATATTVVGEVVEKQDVLLVLRG
jgi:selenide,water dikinase